jgi:hypothetical protein
MEKDIMFLAEPQVRDLSSFQTMFRLRVQIILPSGATLPGRKAVAPRIHLERKYVPASVVS